MIGHLDFTPSLFVIVIGLGILYSIGASIICFIKSILDNMESYEKYIDKNVEKKGISRNYFFGPAYKQLHCIIKDAYTNLSSSIDIVSGSFSHDERIGCSLFGWLFFLVVFIFTYVFGSVILFVFSSIFTLIISIGMGIFYIFFGFLWLIDRLVLAINMLHNRCPEDKRISIIPVFICPRCKKKHADLVPGPYGLFIRICSCGKHLPTTFINGRGSLEAHCPFCDTKLGVSHARQLGIQVIGGVGSGKTTFISAFFHEFFLWLDKKSYTYKKHPEDAFKELETWFQNGLCPATTNRNSMMYSVVFNPNKKIKTQFTLYDIAGEAFIQGSDIQQQQYKYCEKLIFIIDPIAQPKLAEDTILNFTEEFKKIKGKSISSISKIPLAVVITKSDMIEIVKERIYLEKNGFLKLLNILDSEFSQIKYFACSATGRENRLKRSFEPYNVMTPIFWLLSHQ